MKCFNRLIKSQIIVVCWILLTRFPTLAQETPEEVPKSPVDIDPQLTESADQITEAAEKFGLGNSPFAPFLISLVTTAVLGLFFYYIVFAILRAIFRKFKTDLPLVTLGTATYQKYCS